MSTIKMQSTTDPPLPPPSRGRVPADKRRDALFGHAGDAWLLSPTLIADA